jgi:uncharacterized protein
MSDRRTFLKALGAMWALATAAPSGESPAGRDRLGELLPTRPLGRTGQHVTMLGLGGWHIGRMSERDAQATIEAALEGGIRFFDSAESYQDGRSEARLGQFLSPKYRDVVYIMTKTTASDAAAARTHLEGSLRRLKVNRIDLWQMHAVNSPDDVDTRLGGRRARGHAESARRGKGAPRGLHRTYAARRAPARARAHARRSRPVSSR